MCEAEFHLRKILHRLVQSNAGVLASNSARVQYVQFSESLANESSLPVQSNLQLPRSQSLQGAKGSSVADPARGPGGTCPPAVGFRNSLNF